ncbi:M13 family metallopeptidase [Nocardia cyriacigeorgica]|uniref:M13 family metallopeptidase n=1 Tax=Nocardia cyriacigeorgica TaxID=135487 RepID=UPI00189357F0|nr:M13 family metallopeptidase [Nocardia cyriacigeorgica]MBF6083682.1 M13 family metallopeptidase [Nocardia cyriacigeorgica]
MLDRRAFLVALGVVPAAALLVSCSEDEAAQPLKQVDMTGSDPAIRPQDDLYRHVNGKWLREYQLPPDKVSYGAISEANDRTEQQLREIIESISDPEPGSEAQQIRDLYDARMNLDEIEQLGLTPLEPMFAEIDRAKTKAELAAVMGALPIGGLIGLGISIDRKNSDAYIPSIGQSGLGLSEQYYRKPEYAEQLAGYRTFNERLAAAAGLPDPAGLAQRELDLETRIAAGHWDNVRNRDTDATYNRMSWDATKALAPEFDWDPWLEASTLGRPKEHFAEIVVNQPSFVTEAGKIWAETDIALWRDYLKLTLLRQYARFLPKAFADANFDFNGRLMAGLQERPELWKSAVGTVDSNLGEQLGKLYVDKHFPPEAKERAMEMVEDLFAAYRENFTNSSWMSPETRKASIEKLDKIKPKIGYPDKWVDYSELKITRGKLIESLRAVNDFEVERALDRLGTKVDDSEWAMSPQTVNAYYMASTNEIAFPAAYLQPPFFDKDAEAAVNYGAVGATIGHEIGHGFDDQGSKFDGDGNRRDWWTEADRAAFDAKTQQLIEQYNVLVPEGLDPEQHVNGELTVGENLADLRGLLIALAAYRIAEKRRGVDNPDYRSMFLSWARGWRDKQTREVTERLLATDTHSPNEFRCNQVVRNLEEFYTTFGVKEGDELFLPKEQRVSL